MFLEHVNLTVSDLDRALNFYGTLLGLEVRWSGLSSDGRRAAHLGDDRHYLAFFESAPDARSRVTTDYIGVGINHFGFVVPDLDEAKTRLETLGLAAHHEADYDPGRRLYFFDHDGIEVELVEYELAAAS